MPDRFQEYTVSLDSPAENLQEVTPSDSVDLADFCRALNVAEAGVVRVTTVRGDIASVAIAAGIPFPVRVRRVWQTGTTATGIVAMS